MNKIQLSEGEAFLAVADCGAFGTAARELGLTQSTISRRVAALEARIGRRLIDRTTRRVALTEEGQGFAADLRDILLRLADAEARLHQRTAEPQGTLRITMPTAYGRSCVVPRLAEMSARHPKLRFDIDLSDRYVDVIDEGFELAIRLAEPSESGLLSRRIDSFALHICAAPDYLAGQAGIAKPSDLLSHDCIVQRTYAARTNWRIGWQGGSVDLNITPRWTVSDMAAAHVLALSGAGIAVLPSYLVAADLAEGRLRAILPDATLATIDVFAVYPGSKAKLGRLAHTLKAIEN
ncbi:MAG: LysR family transcriptional regulator [Sphingorhabdus sp.]|uniref:LysR family transcriptional regulator n=1 Tax=Sphingorhabdus sp. TaxID=1902408 RepID=UPI0025F8C501|nr:LysR family transcriptional regulator [Sphingorhabdus sp.]MCO4093005.1 LysR family transcriptional regulator [Sphingorhabdus sp.]